MNDFYMQAEARELLEDFESAYSEAWITAQDVLKYINDYYGGDRNRFLQDVAQSCDYCSAAEALRSIFEISEN